LEDQLFKKPKPQSVGDKVMNLVPDAAKNLLPSQIGGAAGQAPSTTSAQTSTTGTGTVTPENPDITATERDHSSHLGAPTQAVSDLSTAGEDGDFLGKADDLNDKGEEHVVEIRECPICHQPRLNKRTDADIITHLATCSSLDWRQVNNIVMGGFVTASQAQRKWYSKVITKISYGGYKLGANSANILVQDRITGQINEERMSVYVRLGIRLLYKGLKEKEMEKKRSMLPYWHVCGFC
jgi:phosphatidylserine decarboxylase